MRKIYLVITRIFLSTLFFLSLQSCSKDEANENNTSIPEENVLNDNAFIVDTLSIISTTENQIIVSENNVTSSYSVGDILLSPPCSNASFGFMRKIISIKADGLGLTYETEQSSLNEAFAELHIDQTFAGGFDLSQQGRLTQINPQTLNFNFLQNTTYFPGLKLDGSLKANFSDITFKYTKKRFTFLPTYVLLKANINTDNSSIEISRENAGFISAPEMTFANFTLPDFYINIPITGPFGIVVRLPIRCVQKVSFKGGELSINGKAKFNILPKISAVMGMKYENGVWENLSSLSIDASASALNQENFNPQLAMNAEFTMFKPVYEVSPYGSDAIKFYAEAPIKLSFDAQTESPNYSLGIDVTVKSGVTSKFWTGEDGGPISISIPLFSEKLKEGDWNLLTGVWLMESFNNGIPVGQYVNNYHPQCPNIVLFEYTYESEILTFNADETFSIAANEIYIYKNMDFNVGTCTILNSYPDTIETPENTASGTYTVIGNSLIFHELDNSTETLVFINPDKIKVGDIVYNRQ